MSTDSPGWDWDEAKRHYPVGTDVQGTVDRVGLFGVFVDLGIGFDGLLHVTEMADGNRNRVEDDHRIGQSITAKVRWHNDQNQTFSLTQRP